MVVADLDAAAAEAAAAVITEESGVPVLAHQVDVTSADSVETMRAAVHASSLCRPSVRSRPSPASRIPHPSGQTSPRNCGSAVFAVNSTGTFLTVRALVPDMIEHGYGRVVTMSSVSAQQGGGVFSKTPYSAAKAAVLGFTGRSPGSSRRTAIAFCNSVYSRGGGYRHPRRRDGCRA